ncbi:MAG: RHS repeat protein, partial [Gammaproteobacteria bacterium]
MLNLPDGSTYTFGSVCPNALKSLTRSDGTGLSYYYTAGLLTKVVSNSGRYVTLTYNSNNFVSQVTDNIGRSVSYTYNSSGQIATVTYPDTTTEQYTYDGNGNMLTVQDRRGNIVTTNRYDANQRVSQQTLADGALYQFAYTLSGTSVSATAVTRPNNAVHYLAFDAAGYPSSITDAYGTSLAQTTTFVRGQ